MSFVTAGEALPQDLTRYRSQIDGAIAAYSGARSSKNRNSAEQDEQDEGW